MFNKLFFFSERMLRHIINYKNYLIEQANLQNITN